MIELQPDHHEIVSRILSEKIPGIPVYVFGSRARGTAKIHSDLDLVLKGDQRQSDSLIADLREAFDESRLPFTVELVDWNRISHDFQAVIREQMVAWNDPVELGSKS